MSNTPRDLAAVAAGKLGDSGDAPPLEQLEEICQTLFLTSLHTEEGTPITCSIAWLNPRKPDPTPPDVVRADRWMFVPFDHPLPFSEQNLAKLALAFDPDTATLAVYPRRNGVLTIYGVVDQQQRLNAFRRFESDRGYDPPGVFQARILGTGHVGVWRGFDAVAELKGGALIQDAVDVLSAGPVLDALRPGFERLRDDAITRAAAAGADWTDDHDRGLAFAWMRVLFRLLNRVKEFQHGGSILVTPRDDGFGLKVKYPFAYRRLRDALLHEQVSAVCAGSAYKEIAARLSRDATGDIPARPYLDERVYATRRDNGREAIEGAIAVTAALTRIDGALCLTPDLVTTGFGCVIGLDDADPILHVTSAPTPTRQQLIRVDAQAYGTRHRSVFRYCSAVPGAVAFVVSQDGHVRAVTRIGQMLTMWDNIRLSMTS